MSWLTKETASPFSASHPSKLPEFGQGPTREPLVGGLGATPPPNQNLSTAPSTLATLPQITV